MSDASRHAMVAFAVLATGCNSTPDVSRPDTSPMRKDHVMAPDIQCSARTADDGRVVVHYEIRNAGTEPIHVIDSKRLPYQLADGAMLVILHGVNPPDPHRLYNLIEIPLTRPLAPGEQIAGEQLLPMARLRDHYSEEAAPAGLLHGRIQVRCDIGWGTTPITAASRRTMSIQQLLAWQQLTRSAVLEVVLP
jgi:hypothetical protein